MPYRLIASTDDLVVCGESFPNVPLFKRDGESPIEAVPSLWAIACIRDYSYSPRTTWAYAESLQSFLNGQELAAPDAGWERATKADVLRFRREMKARGNDSDTEALRLCGVNSFFAWAFAHRYDSRPPVQAHNATPWYQTFFCGRRRASDPCTGKHHQTTAGHPGSRVFPYPCQQSDSGRSSAPADRHHVLLGMGCGFTGK